MSAGKGCQFVFFLLVLAVFCGCSGGGDDTPPPVPLDNENQGSESLTINSLDYTLSYRSVLLEPEDLDCILFDGIDPDDPETRRITILPCSRLYGAIARWDILIAGISETLPRGFMGRVNGMTFFPNAIELTLDVPTLESAFKYLALDFYKTLTLPGMVQEQVYPGVELKHRDGSIVLTVDSLVKDWDENFAATNDQIRVSGEVFLTMGFGVSMDINLWNLDRLEFRPRISQAGQLTFTSGTAMETRDTLVLAVLQAQPFTVGPLVLAPEITLLLDTSGKLSTRTTLGTDFEHGHARDLVYDGTNLQAMDQIHGQAGQLASEQARVNSFGSDFSAALDFTASISPSLDLRFFGRSGFFCSYKDRFNTVALVRTDTNQICRELNVSFDSQLQVDLDLFCDHDLEDDDFSFFHEEQARTIEESCDYLSFFHPVAAIGRNLTVVEGETVILDGRASYDVDDGIHSYTWTQSQGGGVALTGTQSSQASFTAPQVTRDGQVLVFWLTVKDFQGNLDRKSIQITVSDKDGLPAIQGTLKGRVLDYGTGRMVQGVLMDHGTADPLQGVLVEAFERRAGEYAESLIGSAFTDVEGNFTILTLANGCRVEISKPGYLPMTLKDVPVSSNNTTDLGDLLAVTDSFAETGDISITLADFLSNAGIKNANLQLFDYLEGDALETVTTDASGTGVFTDIDAGAYFVKVQAGGYHGITFSLAPSGGPQPVILSLEPTLDFFDEIRLVLSWEARDSSGADIDLDSHLIAPTSTGKRFHLFYPYMHIKNPQSTNLVLKTDAKPPMSIETMIIKNRFDGTYTFRVHDFTHGNSLDTAMLSHSGARVTVFRGYNEVAAYGVPLEQNGNVWNVLTIDGATGDISLIDTMEYQTVQQIIRSAGSYDTSYNVSAK